MKPFLKLIGLAGLLALAAIPAMAKSGWNGPAWYLMKAVTGQAPVIYGGPFEDQKGCDVIRTMY